MTADELPRKNKIIIKFPAMIRRCCCFSPFIVCALHGDRAMHMHALLYALLCSTQVRHRQLFYIFPGMPVAALRRSSSPLLSLSLRAKLYFFMAQ
jgi:hypothetical protein